MFLGRVSYSQDKQSLHDDVINYVRHPNHQDAGQELSQLFPCLNVSAAGCSFMMRCTGLISTSAQYLHKRTYPRKNDLLYALCPIFG